MTDCAILMCCSNFQCLGVMDGIFYPRMKYPIGGVFVHETDGGVLRMGSLSMDEV